MTHRSRSYVLSAITCSVWSSRDAQVIHPHSTVKAYRYLVFDTPVQIILVNVWPTVLILHS